jgi:hypothetical protein
MTGLERARTSNRGWDARINTHDMHTRTEHGVKRLVEMTSESRSQLPALFGRNVHAQKRRAGRVELQYKFQCTA